MSNDYLNNEETPEYIICAAIWYKEQNTASFLPINIKRGVIIGGHRHPHCRDTFIALTGKRSVLPECGEYEQGFITNMNRFVSREEAAIIAFNAKQIDRQITSLHSEDLY